MTDRMLGLVLNERYRLDVELGQGAMGVVYLARDVLLNRRIAVKVIRQAGLSAGVRERMLTEAQASARLNHPNIAGIYDAGEASVGVSEEPVPFIVMELAEGLSLRQRPPSSTEEILTIAQQICGALDHAHRQQIVHRDLKPENVLCLPDGTVKLVDFGLARSIASRMSQEGTIAGTVLYLAPELATSGTFDGRADLYALGVMLYEFTTGAPPFNGIEPVAIISQHIHAPVVPPRGRNADIPLALNTLILKLLEKEPANRPPDASTVGQALARIETGGPGVPTDGTISTEFPSLERIVHGPIIGRSEELRQVREIWGRAAGGDGQVLIFSGESGIGKSRMLRELLTHTAVAGHQGFVGECYPEGSVPYAAFGQILNRIFDAADVEALDLPAFVLADLLTVAPGLRLRYPDVPANPQLDGKAEQYRLFENLGAFIGRLCARSPIIIGLEDIHWADRGTLALFRYLARQSPRHPLLLAANMRPAEPDPADMLPQLLLDLNRERLLTEIRLERLDLERTRQLLATIFSEEITEDFLAGIYRVTEGNPFFTEEVCKALVEDGKVYYRSGRWHRPPMDELELPASIRIAIQSRVQHLPESAKETLLLASILGREFSFEVLQRAGGRDEEALLGDLEVARRAQLIDEIGPAGAGRFSFAHGLMPAALRESVSGMHRARMHRKVVEALENLHPNEFEAIAHHAAHAGEKDRARENYLKAARRALHSYANEDSIRFYTAALELTETLAPVRFELLAERLRVYDLVAQRDLQLADAEGLLAIAEQTGNDEQRCDALLALADVYLVTEHSRALEHAERAVSLARTLGDFAREGHALRRVGEQAHRAYDLGRSRSALETAAARFRRTGLPGEAAACLSILSVVLGYLGQEEAARRAADEAVAFSREAGDRRQEGTALRRLAIIHLDQGQFGQALLYAEAALNIHRELGDRYEEGNDLNALGIIQAKLGQEEEAEASLRASLSIASSIDSITAILYAINNLIHFSYRPQGEYQKALSFIEDQLKQALELEDEFFIGTLHRHKATMMAALGQYDQALEANRLALPVAERLMGDRAKIRILAAIGGMLAELGRTSEARHELARALKLADRTADPLVVVYPLIGFARLALIDGRRAELRAGLERVERAAQLLAGQGGVWMEELGEALCTAARLRLCMSKGEDVYAHKALDDTSQVLHLASSSPEVAPEEMYNYLHALGLQLLGRSDEAQIYLQRAYQRVLLVSNKTEEETYRQGWLESVQVNREILSAWHEWGMGS